MKPVSYLILGFICCVGLTITSIDPAMAQDASAADPLISLTVKNEPLGAVLETITRDTGYRFNLNRSWQDHPVSATIGNLPLEKGLKRLLRSLNYTIIWESDKLVTIMVFGKTEPGSSGPAISFQSPPQTYQEEIEPTAEIERAVVDEPEPADAGDAAADSAAVEPDDAKREPGEVAPTPEVETPDQPPVEPAEATSSTADAPPAGAGAND